MECKSLTPSSVQSFLFLIISMTRITNFGGKRTYIQAGFEDQRVQKIKNVSEMTVVQVEGGHALDSTLHENVTSSEPPKKKRKRTPKSKRTNFKDPVNREGNFLTEECGTAREVGGIDGGEYTKSI